MNLREIAELVNAETLCGGDRLNDIEVPNAYACDLMSDVLAFC